MKLMTRLYLIRHGQVAGHDTGRINGQTDVSLTPLGRAQAQAAARRVDAVRLDGIYSSDLSRADYRAACVARGREMSHRPFANCISGTGRGAPTRKSRPCREPPSTPCSPDCSSPRRPQASELVWVDWTG